jgi:site-specific DNA recombinase
MLRRNGKIGSRRCQTSLLRGLLRCSACDAGMIQSITSKGTRRYRYYVCRQAQQRGWAACPSPSVPAEAIERLVVQQIRHVGQNPALAEATIAEAKKYAANERLRLEEERSLLESELESISMAMDELAALPRPTLADRNRSDELQDRKRSLASRLIQVDRELESLRPSAFHEDVLREALEKFDGVWDALLAGERQRVLELLIDHIGYDGPRGSVSITFKPGGIEELATREKCRA